MNRLLIIFICVLISIGLKGQKAIEFGVVGGFGISRFVENNDRPAGIDTSPSFAYNIGGWASLRLSDWMNLRTDLRYFSFSSKLQRDFSKLNLTNPNDPAFIDIEILGTIRESGIALPIVLEVGTENKICAHVGVQFGLFPNGKQLSYDTDMDLPLLLGDNIDGADVSIVGGANYYVDDRMFLELRAIMGTSPRNQFNLGSLQVGVGYQF